MEEEADGTQQVRYSEERSRIKKRFRRLLRNLVLSPPRKRPLAQRPATARGGRGLHLPGRPSNQACEHQKDRILRRCGVRLRGFIFTKLYPQAFSIRRKDLR